MKRLRASHARLSISHRPRPVVVDPAPIFKAARRGRAGVAVTRCAMIAACIASFQSAHAAAPHALPADLFNDAPPQEITAHYSGAEATDDALQKLRANIEEILRAPSLRGHELGATIVALSTGQTLYAHNADAWLKPASNTKILTTAAAYDILSENWRPTSRLVSKNAAKDARISGDVALHGKHDLSWSPLFYPSANYPAQQLIRQLKDQGIERIDGDVIVHGTFVFDGYHFGTLDTATERNQIAECFRKALIQNGIRLNGSVRVSHAPLPDDYSEELARWEGPALAPVVDEINRVSHNEFADMLLLAIAQHDGGNASYTQGARVIRRWLDDHSFPTDGLSLHDGSGLSHDNRISAALLTQITAYVQHQPWAERWNASLSPAGVDGTYVNRMLSAKTRGRVLLKSGTINGVISSSGLYYHPSNGEVYAISLLLNQVANQPAARTALDQIVTALSDFPGDASRPTAPALQSAKLQNNQEVELRWDAAKNAKEYLIEARDETSAWTHVEVVSRRKTRTTLPRSATPKAYRVRAINDAGISPPSTVLLAGGSRNAPNIVLVEGNERWLAEPHAHKNALGEPHGFLQKYMEPLTGYRVQSVDNHTLLKTELDANSTVIFALGREANDTEALSKAEREWIEGHLARGGRVVVSGAEAAWDIQSHVNDGADYLDRVFGAAFIADSAQDTVACMEDPDGKTDETCAHFWSRGEMQVKWPDALSTTRGERCMRYGNDRYDACVYHDGAMLVGFPLESIDNQEERIRVMRSLLEQIGVEHVGVDRADEQS